jgi:predicted acetyltransferase
MAVLDLRKASSEENLESLLEMHQEVPAEETGFTNPAYGMDANEFKSYVSGLQAESKGAGLSEGRVPMTTYWLFQNSKPVGISRFNHMLTPDLLRAGGHVSYAIRPTARGQGLGNEILKLTLEEVKHFVSGRVLLTCLSNNDRSRRVIEANGGIVEESLDEAIARYWIIL